MPTDAELRLARLPVDPGEYDLEDAAGTVGSAPRRWRWTVERLEEIPGAAVVALEGLADALSAAGGEGDDLDALTRPVVRELRALADRHGPRARLVEHLGAHHPLLTATESVDVLLSAAGRSVAGMEQLAGTGRIEQVNLGGGGVPKSPVASAALGRRGLLGDRQATRRHHGRPFQAVCLYAAEVIDALVAEGHPITPGAVGENVTLSGLDWASLRPGVRLVLGDPDDPVCLELTSWVPPCRSIAPAFLDGDFNRIDHDRHPGWSRAYAVVLRPGGLTPGSPVRLLP